MLDTSMRPPPMTERDKKEASIIPTVKPLRLKKSPNMVLRLLIVMIVGIIAGASVTFAAIKIHALDQQQHAKGE